MPVTLKDAKIRVVLDLSEGKAEQEGLEERVKRTRKDQEDADRASKAPRGREARNAVRTVLHGAPYRALRNLLSSIPLFGIGVAAAAGAAELNERFGPIVEGAIEEVLSKKYGVSLEVLTAGAKGWGELKIQLTTLSEAFERTKKMAAATIIGGGALTAEDALDLFKRQREMAVLEAEIEKTRRRIEQRELGAGVARSVREAIEKAAAPGMGK